MRAAMARAASHRSSSCRSARRRTASRPYPAPRTGTKTRAMRWAAAARGGGGRHLNPARCRILAVGKVRRGWIQDGIDLYLKRLPGLTISELRDSNPDKEADAIRAALRPDETLIALLEQGDTLASVPFAQRLEQFGNQRLAFVIGGADGLTAELKAQAQWHLSLSPMTFPHELARLMLVEQLFRAQAIVQGSPYHRA